MTTIAIDHDSISADGRCTDSQGFIGDDAHNKLNRHGEIIYAYAGMVADAEILVDAVIFGGDVPNATLEASLVTIQDEIVEYHFLSNGRVYTEIVKPPYSMGSGDQFALAAMDFGSTSKEAVKYAMKRDSGTGGKIKTIKYKKG